MQIRVAGKQVDIGEALPLQVGEKLSAALEKYFGGRGEAHVTFAPEGAGYRADCTVHLDAGHVLKSEGEAGDVYHAFDVAMERLEKQLRRAARRVKNHHE